MRAGKGEWLSKSRLVLVLPLTGQESGVRFCRQFEIIELSNFTKGKQQNYYLKLLYVEITPVPKIIICIWFEELPGYNVSVLYGDIWAGWNALDLNQRIRLCYSPHFCFALQKAYSRLSHAMWNLGTYRNTAYLRHHQLLRKPHNKLTKKSPISI